MDAVEADAGLRSVSEVVTPSAADVVLAMDDGHDDLLLE